MVFIDIVISSSHEQSVDYFLIKWKGWSSAFNSWETRENLGNCRELLEEYEKELNVRVDKSKEEEEREMKKYVQTREAQLTTILEFLMERYHDNLLEDFLEAISEIKKIHWLLRVRRTKMSFLSKFSKFSKIHKVSHQSDSIYLADHYHHHHHHHHHQQRCHLESVQSIIKLDFGL